MDILSSAARTRLRESWRVRYLKAFTEGAQTVADRICEATQSSAEIEVYMMLAAIPVFQKFKDQAKKQNLQWIDHRIPNEEFEATIDIPIKDLERDKMGRWNNRFDMLGIGARRWADARLAQVMTGAFTQKDYTGLNFFDEDKPHVPGVVGAQTFTNKMTEKPSAGSWEKARLLMGNILDMNGQPMGLGINKIVVSSTKWSSTFRRILNAETVLEVVGDAGGGVTNIYKGDATYIEFPFLNTEEREDNWFVIDASYPMRPFINQSEVKPQFFAVDDPNSELAVTKKVFTYQGYLRGEIGFGLPQLCIGSTGADAAL